MNKEYFTYGLATQEGKYSISLQYPFLARTYGVNAKKSKINADKAKAHQIIEIDIAKIDTQNNIGYRELIRDRNNLYLKYFLRNFSAMLIAIIILILSLFAQGG